MMLRAAASSHAGRRSNNEDAAIADAALGLYAVADGVGGVEGGEIASAIVVDTLRRFFRRAGADAGTDGGDASRLETAIRMADREIARRRVGDLDRMASTVAAVRVRGMAATVAWVGDSRVYLWRDGSLIQLTADHTVAAEMSARGLPMDAAGRASWGHVLSRAVGTGATSRPELLSLRLRTGDVLMLCTDGLTDVLDDEALARLLPAAIRDANPADRLVAAALEADADDNVTVVLVRVDDDGALFSSERTVPVRLPSRG